MKSIALEEHFQNTKIKEATEKFRPDVLNAQNGLASNPSSVQLENLGAGRLQAMDTMGVDVQVLSCVFDTRKYAIHLLRNLSIRGKMANACYSKNLAFC